MPAGVAGLGVVVVGGAVWWAWPGGSGNGAAATGTGGPTGQRTSSTDATRSASPTATASGATTASGGLLSPDGIRTPIAAIEAASGWTMFSDLVVQPETVSVRAMVPGSSTGYDRYTYRADTGAEKGIISGSPSGGDQPVSLKNFGRDAVPALITKAEKDLKVSKPTTRNLALQEPNTVFDTAAGMMIHLSNAYHEGGWWPTPRARSSRRCRATGERPGSGRCAGCSSGGGPAVGAGESWACQRSPGSPETPCPVAPLAHARVCRPSPSSPRASRP
ncbi:hypothetical protein ACIO13_26475 [Streptomyces sp. NPDC087425]|uniref:hypothetical protein n=1 Tax=Streptomyces sp. NPDC087425 TaxID=3365787 RepID=UPI0038061E88